MDATVRGAGEHVPDEWAGEIYEELFECYRAIREASAATWGRLQAATRKASSTPAAGAIPTS